jgi:hypothetical protein
MELSENLKLRLDHTTGETQQDRLARAADPNASADNGPIDEAESQMRKALGLLGEGQRHRSEPDRNEPPSRIGDRFNNGLHRRRFVQDGDIPVTVLRRDQGHDVPTHRGVAPATPPSNSRLQRTEAALAAETAAREKAERSLAEAHAHARDLQTKIGHAELAKNEALEAARQDREVIAQLRIDAEAWAHRLQEALAQARSAEQIAEALQQQLSDERQARKAAEKTLRTVEVARDEAEQLARSLSEEAAQAHPPQPVLPPRAEPAVIAVKSGRKRLPAAIPVVEPEPVKWWLNAKPTAKRR